MGYKIINSKDETQGRQTMNIKKILKDNWMLTIIFPLSFCIPMTLGTAFALGWGYTPLFSVQQLFIWLGITVVVSICLGIYTFYKLSQSNSDNKTKGDNNES